MEATEGALCGKLESSEAWPSQTDPLGGVIFARSVGCSWLLVDSGTSMVHGIDCRMPEATASEGRGRVSVEVLYRLTKISIY